ncbi:extracellular solute-binding protein [Cohnella sp. GCM10020058]|uniref:extracellular solute-binding protein n=1 Tax=Cohnella sp. GCM10020058 TaxID=3317330 RepID=UPI00363FD12E
MKRTKALLLLFLLPLLICGCDRFSAAGGQQITDSSDAPPPVTLLFQFFGDKPTDLDLVIREFEKRTSDSLRVKLETEWDAPEEYKQKIKLKLAAGESVDAVFDASWMNLNQNVAQGYYQVLDKYFNNDDYPGLKKAFPADYLDANRINGHIYALPLTQLFHDIELVFIRKDLREKFGMQPIRSMTDLERYLERVRREEPSMIPLALKGERGFYRMFESQAKQTNYRASPTALSGTGVAFQVVLSDDGKHVLGAATYGDPASEYADFPAPLNQPDYFTQVFDQNAAWNRFVQTDVLNERNALLLLESGKAAASEGTVNDWASTRQKLKTAVPDAELEGFVYIDCQRKREAGCIGTDYRAWNDLAIPVTSKHADETMRFLDWLFQSQENHDLFELGIKGKHWTEGAGGAYYTTSESSDYAFPAFELTWNPYLSRIGADVQPEVQDLLAYEADPASYYRLPLLGFQFDPAPVKTEIAKIQPLANQTMQVLGSGLDLNWQESLAAMNKKLRGLGLERIREELIRQIQAYLDSGGT